MGTSQTPFPPGTATVLSINLGILALAQALQTLVTGWIGLTLLSDTRLLGTDFLDVSIFALMTQANNQ